MKKIIIASIIGLSLSMSIVSAQLFSSTQDNALVTFGILGLLTAWAFSQFKNLGS